MYRNVYRPCSVERQQNADHYDSAMSASDKYRRLIDPSLADSDGRNAIHLAVLCALRDASSDGSEVIDKASLSAIEQAVRADCDVNAVDRWGRRPIHYAAEAGHLASLRQLIHYNADPNALTGPSSLQLHESSSNRNDVIGFSPLMVAARRGRIEAIKFLLKNGAKASLKNSNGETALHHAAACTVHPEECINALLSTGARSSLLNAQDSAGNTALMVAIRNKSSHAAVAAIECLISHGADVELTDTEDRTALHLAAQKNLPEVIDLLTKKNIDLNVVDKRGHTAYVTAIEHDSAAALQSLIDAGCDGSSIDGLMGTAVGLAALRGHAKVIETLVRNGEDPDECAFFGKTPLMLAGFECRVQAVDTLLRLGADPDARSRSGGTALVAAILRIEQNNEVERHAIIKNLIRFGADVNRRACIQGNASAGQNYFRSACSSTTGRDWPLSYAIDSGYVSLVRILVIAGGRMSNDEIKDRLANSSSNFYDCKELLFPVLEVSAQPFSLQHLCRVTVRRAVLAHCRNGGQHISGMSPRHIDDAIASLPIAVRYRRYLSFDELDDINIQRARTSEGTQIGMFPASQNTPCGLRAVMGILLSQQQQP